MSAFVLLLYVVQSSQLDVKLNAPRRVLLCHKRIKKYFALYRFQSANEPAMLSGLQRGSLRTWQAYKQKGSTILLIVRGSFMIDLIFSYPKITAE